MGALGLTQYYTATTLDGFIADEHNSLDWLFTRDREERGPQNYEEFVAEVGALAMGATTYEWILGCAPRPATGTSGSSAGVISRVSSPARGCWTR